MISDDWRPPTLTTARLVLRPVTADDAEAVYAYASNPNLTRFTLWDTHRSLSESIYFVREYARSRYREGVPEPVAIALREAPEVMIGSLGIFWAEKPSETMELGYALAEAYWGRGLIVEACRPLIGSVFAAYPVVRLQARVIEGNKASMRVLEKLGFTFEGTLRSSLLLRGRHWDVLHYSLLRAEHMASG